MDQPLLATAPRRWRLNPFARPPAPAVEPSPQALADLLHSHRVHRTAAKQLDTYERAEAQHREERKAKARLLLGTAGLVLGLSPAVPGVYSACHGSGPSWDCGLRSLALAGGALALTSSLWLGWDLYHHPNRLTAAAQRVSQALARSMQAKSDSVPVEDLFHRYRAWGRHERQVFTEHLHRLASQPKRGGIGPALARTLDPTLAV